MSLFLISLFFLFFFDVLRINLELFFLVGGNTAFYDIFLYSSIPILNNRTDFSWGIAYGIRAEFPLRGLSILPLVQCSQVDRPACR